MYTGTLIRRMFQNKYEDIVVLIRTNRTDKTGLVMFRTVRTVFKC